MKLEKLRKAIMNSIRIFSITVVLLIGPALAVGLRSVAGVLLGCLLILTGLSMLKISEEKDDKL